MDIKKNTFFLISIGAIPGALFRWIVDDILVVNLILVNEYDQNADINSDNILNVIDAIQIINIILNN